MDLATAFQKYAQNENGQLVLQFSGTEYLCKISIEDGEAIGIRLGRLDVDEIIDFVKSHEIVEVSFIKGFVSKQKLTAPITERLFGIGGFKPSEGKPTVRKAFSGGEQISAAKVNNMISLYVDTVGPLGVVIIENLLKKINYVRDSPISGADYIFVMEKLVEDMPEDLRAEFLKTIK